MIGCYPPGFGSSRDWAHVCGEDLLDDDQEDRPAFDPCDDDGGYSQSD